MNDTQKILALEELKALKARYFRCVDTKDWAGFGAVFAADAELDISDDAPGQVVSGREAIVEAARGPLEGCVSVHHGHCPEIELTSDDTATGVWAMEDMLQWDEDAASPFRSLHGFGHYHETYARIDGRWQIRTLKLSRLRLDVETR